MAIFENEKLKNLPPEYNFLKEGNSKHKNIRFFPMIPNLGWSIFGVFLQLPFALMIIFFGSWLITDSLIFSTDGQVHLIYDWQTPVFSGIAILIFGIWFAYRIIQPIFRILIHKKKIQNKTYSYGLYLLEDALLFLLKNKRFYFVKWKNVTSISVERRAPNFGDRTFTTMPVLAIKYSGNKKNVFDIMYTDAEIILDELTGKNTEEKLKNLKEIIKEYLN